MVKFKGHDPFPPPLRTFTSLTFELIRQREFENLEVCFGFIERFLAGNDPSIRFALVAGFVPSLYAYLQECEWKKEVVNRLPEQLRKEYCSRGCVGKIKNDYTQFVIHLN